jgi:DNA-binding MarR family transcriptional regulator
MKLDRNKRGPRGHAQLEQEAFVALARTADALARAVESLLKSADVSPSQYNVLRILRGAGARGLCCHEVGERMITRDPDITRLFDRLEKRGLIERWRNEKDRRVVMARISKPGRALLARLDSPVADLHRAQLGHLSDSSLKQLINLLRLPERKQPALPSSYSL